MLAGDRVGAYALIEKLGEGGFGEVWKAEHSERPGIPVAVKVPTDPAFVSALRKEGMLQHAIDHPLVVKVLEVDTAAEPPHLVMEYIAGESLRARLDRERKLGAQEAVAIVGPVLEALEAAHAAGLVHRDVKPGNVLLREGGGAVLADFGLGKVTKAAAASVQLSGKKSSMSAERSIAGTFDYMAPEQRRGEEGDHRVDLYACGVLLYEMLTGEVYPLRLPVRGAPKALSSILELALEGAAERRFTSAAAMRKALQEAMTIASETRIERLRWRLSHAARAVTRIFTRKRPSPPAWVLQREVTLLATLEGHTDPVSCGAVNSMGNLLATGDRGGYVNLWLPMQRQLSKIFSTDGTEVLSVALSPDSEMVAAGCRSGGIYLFTTAGGAVLARLNGLGPVHWLSFTPNGKALVAASDIVNLWEVPKGLLFPPMDVPRSKVSCAALSPDGWILAAGGEDGSVHLWHASRARRLSTFSAHQGPVTSIAFRKDGRALVTGGKDWLARVWRVPEGVTVATLSGHGASVSRAVFSPDGRWIATAAWESTVQLWSTLDGTPRPLRHEGPVRSAVFSPDGLALFALHGTGGLRLWSVADGRGLAEFTAHDKEMTFAAFARDSAVLFTGGEDKKVKVWLMHGGPAPDWEKGGEPTRTFPQIQTKVSGDGVAYAGDVLWIDVTVTNHGPSDLFQAWAEIDAIGTPLHGLVCAFGRIRAGESASRRIWRVLPAHLAQETVTGIFVLHDAHLPFPAADLAKVEFRPLPRPDVSVRWELRDAATRKALEGKPPRVRGNAELRLVVRVESSCAEPLARLRLVLCRIDPADDSRLECARVAVADLIDGDETDSALRLVPSECLSSGLSRLELRLESDDGRVFAIEPVELLVE